ncbi:MAG: hypothetical protein O6700_08990 [Gammaproteobacteria bacterium]|jgi:hypothetical protein|nr:hypothetical protein [Gammaproteobacteria bacterium]
MSSLVESGCGAVAVPCADIADVPLGQFGRFLPVSVKLRSTSMNGREPTPEEIAFLKEPSSGV